MFMRKLVCTSVLLLGYGLSSSLFAEAVSATASPSATDGSSSEQVVAGSSSNYNKNFEYMADIGQKIEMENKKIQELKMQQELRRLSGVQKSKDVGLSIVRIEGFDHHLSAIVADAGGAIERVQVGDTVGNHFRVTSIKPLTVKVIDVQTNKRYTLPFQKDAKAETSVQRSQAKKK
jgi:type IV pilus biogenesis protein PilP